MIDYETWSRIQDVLKREHLNYKQAAQALGLHPQTVAAWAKRTWRKREQTPRASRLDPYKGRIVGWLDAHPYSAVQIAQRLRECGYTGGITTVRDYVRRIRPRSRQAFLKLSFQPGEAAQIDWGEWGTIGVGNTRRRLSFFVMVLCYSRMLYVEFCVSQQMEQFLGAHLNAFAALGVPQRLIIDNLRSAVLRRHLGEAPVFNPRYLDFARHCGFEISACNVRAAHEKGRVERGVGYVKSNLLNGLQLADLASLNASARLWLDTVANVRIHGATHRKPIEMYAEEQALLRPLNERPYDIARVLDQRVSPQLRVVLDTNTYSVPARYASQRVTLKAWPQRVCVYHGEQLIARHVRCYDRHQDIEDPEHAKPLLAQRKSAREQRLMLRFLALSAQAQAYYDALAAKRANARDHVRRIVALAENHGDAAVARALEDGLAFGAFSAEYVANTLEMRERRLDEPAPLQLARRADLLELDLAPADLSLYDRETP